MKKYKGHMGSTIKFKSEQDRSLFMHDFNSESGIIKIFNNWNYRGTYDTKSFDFEDIIISELISKKLLRKKILKNLIILWMIYIYICMMIIKV